MPRDDGTFYLDTDASDKGVRAVLSQEQDGMEVVLAYASRTLSKPERNYDVTRRELLAVVFGLKTYRQYSEEIRRDHSALESLRRTPEPIGQQARWQTFIELSLYVVSTPVTCLRLFPLILAPHLIRSTIRHFFASLSHRFGVKDAAFDWCKLYLLERTLRVCVNTAIRATVR